MNAKDIMKTSTSSTCTPSPTSCCHRRQTLEALQRSAVHQSLSTPSSQVAMARCRTATLDDPAQAMEVLRSLLQPAINAEISKALNGFVVDFFRPAAKNAHRNVSHFSNNIGNAVSSEKLVEEACMKALDVAKEMFKHGAGKGKVVQNGTVHGAQKRKIQDKKPAVLNKKAKVSASGEDTLNRPNSDLILVTKTGKPVRREGPLWEPKRLTSDTLFILGSKANKALGFGQTRGRLYIKHPELFKYSGDQEDKEWLARNQLMSTTGGKAYLMVLSDILELVRSSSYATHPRQQPNELAGFTVPPFLLAKMRRFVAVVRTRRDMADGDLIAHGEEQIAQWEGERRRLAGRAAMAGGADKPRIVPASVIMDTGRVLKTEATDEDEKEEAVEDMALGWVKTESVVKDTIEAGDGDGGNDEELGFLNGMNLNSLVRELEMEAEGPGSARDGSLRAILSLADDDIVEDQENGEDEVNLESVKAGPSVDGCISNNGENASS